MVNLVTLLEQHLDRQPLTAVIQAITWWETVLALVKLQECGLEVYLPVKVCCILHSGWLCITSRPIFKGEVVHWLFIHVCAQKMQMLVFLCTASLCMTQDAFYIMDTDRYTEKIWQCKCNNIRWLLSETGGLGCTAPLLCTPTFLSPKVE